jgi:hypothetical protein
MTVELDPAIFDDLFHGAAWAAYIEIAIATGAPPDCEAPRHLAFQYYEEALAERHERLSE